MSPPRGTAASGLNPQQRAVVDRLEGNTFVSAGAGSGKTRVLAERFVAVVLSAGEADARSDAMRRVLLTTFTEKAAGELGERVRRMLLESGHPELSRMVDEAWISTIHGFCARIVRRHALELGIDPAFRVLVDPQASVARQEAFEESARVSAGESPDVAALLEIHGVAEVRRAVHLGFDQIRAMGRSPGELEVDRAPDVASALRAWLREMPELCASYEALRPLAFVRRNIETLAGALVVLRQVASMTPHEIPRAIVEIAEGLRIARPGNATGAERELTLGIIDRMDAVTLLAVDAVASTHADAFSCLLASYAASYETRKRAMGALDFEDLQSLAATVFAAHPEITARYAERFLAVMVDEFQDTNDLQMRVLEPIARGRLCVVGDDKQSIYGFRFADVAIFERQRETQTIEEPGGVCPLQVNYRSHPDLLATLNELFDAAPFFDGGHLRLEAGRTGGWRVAVEDGAPRVEVIEVDRSDWHALHWRDAEARVLARRIRQLVAGGVDPSDIVVLLRQMTTARPYVDALREEGLDVVARSASGFFAAPEISDIRALLAVMANPRDAEAVIKLLAGGLGGVSDDALFLLSQGLTPPQGLWRAVRDAASSGLSASDATRCALVAATVETLRAEQGRVRLADQLLDAAAILGPGGGCLAREGAWENIRKAARIAAQLEETTHADPATLLGHLEEREAFMRAEATAPVAREASAVRVMTVHAAKGLEFPIVAVADLGHEAHVGRETLSVVKSGDRIVAAARLPTSYGDRLPVATIFQQARAAESERSAREDARLFYVACSRAEELLILSGGCDLDKEPGTTRPIDRLRRVLDAPGHGGVPGVRVDVVDASSEGELQRAGLGVEGFAAREPAGDGSSGAVTRRAMSLLASPTELSYTALALYERCPFRFFVERMLRLDTYGEGEGEGGPLELGSAVHAALQLLARGTPPDAGRLEALARYHRLGDEDRTRLEEAVSVFGRSDLARTLSAHAVRTEVDFSVPVAGRMLAGTLDMLAILDGMARVIDYKTGRTELSADQARARFERQAQVYALAVLRDGHDSVQVHFVEVERDGRETDFEFTADQTAGLEETIGVLVGRIERGEFPRLASFDHAACGDCPAHHSLCGIGAGEKGRGPVRER